MNLIGWSSVRVWSGAACLLVLTSSLLLAQQPKLSRTLVAGAAPVSLAFSPDGKTVAWVKDPWGDPAGTRESPEREIRLLDITTGKDIATLRGYKGGVWPLVFSPDGKTLASGGADGMINLWDVPGATRADRTP
jgi:WD40 repeat protein